MKLVNQYIIPLTGLKEGEHNYNFLLEGAFFEEFSVLETEGGRVDVKILLEKTSNLYNLSISLSGNLIIQCDRCLDNFDFPIVYQGSFFVKFKEQSEESNDQVLYLNQDDDEIYLGQIFMEYIATSLPLHKSHPEDENGTTTCNKGMIDLLEKYSEPQTNNKEIDPRWSKLKDIYKKES